MKKRVSLSLFIVCLILLSSFEQVHAFVGNNPLPATQEDTIDNEVNLNSGEANHAIKLDVPPGTNNLTPSLSLDYHSSAAQYQSYNAFRSGNLFGIGWSIDFPYIYRDTNNTPSNTSDDKYKIDWQGASYDLVDQGSGLYKTNIETFTNITHVTTGNDYWTVQSKDGTTYRFGYNADSEVACSNRSFTLEWVLDNVKDTHSNNIYYNYLQNPNASDIGAIYPLNIKYNNDQSREIDFTRDPVDATGMAKNYFGGCLVRYARNIKTITTKTNGATVKTYTLNYSGTVSRSLLSSVTETGSDNATTLPATSFTNVSEQSGWPGSTTSWGDPGTNNGNTWFIDMTGDGLPDVVYFDSQGWKIAKNTGSGFSSLALWGNPGPDKNNTHLVDMNGDGRPDMLYWDSSGWYVWWNKGNQWDTTRTTWGTNGPNTSMPMDMNGDGLTDLLYWDSGGWKVWFNTGSSFSSSSTA